MAYDVDLANRLRHALGDIPGTAEKAMFGGISFLVCGHLVITASTYGNLLVSCPKERTQEFLERDGVTRARMGKRTMSEGWLAVEMDVVRSDVDLDFWVGQALDFSEGFDDVDLGTRPGRMRDRPT
ncbi:TfoX/Sxy family protein [Ornithinimicrobium sp. INDO-MA30-4]|uniref:TfoX/Sxy family protein n=1 Tax=Ornithinimicrobium sp. INDO-MA30-4 TaxID=2908651 RepID=UPI001F3B6414|nr:TfoX/Sxy family protein [Ornithinimicrobium sp. INDO-MA30-4]UJH70251.1 TfoX/Sxy family protein [Ornithinimicrobium sp. INDO-MA30-4]